MKTNKEFRRFGDDSRGGESLKGKYPLKEKKSKRSIYDEIEEDEDIGFSNFRKKESVEDYFDDYEDEEANDEEFDFVNSEYGEYDEYNDEDEY